MGSGPNDSGMSRVSIFNAIEASLKRLRTDYIDIYYIHHVDTQTPLDEMLAALDDLVRQGKVRYTACSNYEAWRLGEAIRISDVNHLTRFTCYQPQYSLVVRDIEQELIPLCQLHGLGVVVWSPLGGGFLSGKYQPGQRKIDNSRSADGWAFPSRTFADNADETLKVLLATAQELGHSPAQVAIRWTIEQPAITSTIVGARNCEQLSDNLSAGKWRFNEATRQRLNEISQLKERYPQSIEKTMVARREDAVNMPSL
jgi:aryl-alcohol dehydrogenase-like predicted oxidoreductase